MGYNVEATSADCYPGTTCLINKLEIRDEKLLSEIEADITFAKATELELTPIPGQFDFEHYKAIHRYLFEDLCLGRQSQENRYFKKGYGFC